MTTSQLRFGLLGTAEIAARRFIPAARRVPGVTVDMVGGRDADSTRSWAQAQSIDRFGSYRAVLDDPDIDAVYIALPNALHAQWADAALRAGHHVLVEKPITMRAADTEALFDLARRHGRTLMECMTFPRHRQHRDAEIAAGPIEPGPQSGVSARFTIPSRPASDIRHDPTLGGGSLADLGGYLARFAVYHLTEPIEVVQAELVTDPSRGVDTAGSVVLSDARGRWAELQFAFDTDYTCEYTLHGAWSTVRVNRAFTMPPDTVPDITTTESNRSDSTVRLGHVDSGPDDQFGSVVADFVLGVRQGVCVDSEVTVRTSRLLDRIREVDGAGTTVAARDGADVGVRA